MSESGTRQPSIEQRLITLLAECEARLALLSDRYREEAARRPRRLDVRQLTFLDREKAVYGFAVSLLKSLQSGPGDGHS